MVSAHTHGARFFCPYYEELRAAFPVWDVGAYKIVRCADSGLVYLGNPLSEEELKTFYSLQYFEGESSRKGYASYAADEGVLRLNFQRSLSRVSAVARDFGQDPARLRLLDYGCAYGYFLDEARSTFGAVCGIELNSEVAEVARQRFGLSVESGTDAVERMAAQSLDVVTMWDVIEHLSKPRTTLQAAARVLRPGGVIHLTTGDIGSLLARVMGRRWRLVNPPQHICYFSWRTLCNLLGECGFDVIAVRRPGKRVSLSFVRFILRYLAGVESKGGEESAFWRKSLYVNLFDVIHVVARRRNEVS